MNFCGRNISFSSSLSEFPTGSTVPCRKRAASCNAGGSLYFPSPQTTQKNSLKFSKRARRWALGFQEVFLWSCQPADGEAVMGGLAVLLSMDVRRQDMMAALPGSPLLCL
jgi:hypothetical protein